MTDDRECVVVSLGGSVARATALADSTYRSIADMMSEVPSFDPDRDRTLDIGAMPSNEASFGDWLAIVGAIRNEDAKIGVVVSHGTDSIIEALHVCGECLGASNRTIAFTGAMRPGYALGSDALRNLDDALLVARAVSLGTILVENGSAYPGWSVAKHDTSSIGAFQAVAGGRLGRIQARSFWPESGNLTANWLGFSGIAVRPEHVASAIMLVPGIGRREVSRLLTSAGTGGLVVQSFGGGVIPAATLREMKAAARDVRIVVTRGPETGVLMNDELYGDHRARLIDAGVLVEDVLDTRRARVRLSLSLEQELGYPPFHLG